MRRSEIVTWVLILTIANFALGAPAAVRERLEISLDVDVAKGGRAMSQKRFDSLDSWSTRYTNVVGRLPGPQGLNPSELDGLWEGDGHSPPPPESPGSTSESSIDVNWPPSIPGSPTSPHPGPTGDSPLPDLNSGRPPSNPESPTGHPGPSGGSSLPPLPHPGPSEDRPPGPPGGSENPDTLSSIGAQPPPPQTPSPARDPFTRPPPSPQPLPDEFWNTLLEGSGSPQPHPGSPEDHFLSPSGGSVNQDTLPSTGSQPPSPPPQSPAQETTHPSSPGPMLDEFWNKLMNAKIKPRISSSGTVNSVR